MAAQTVTRSIETPIDANSLYRNLAHPANLPLWAPGFADRIEHLQANTYRITKAASTFNMDLHLNETALTADFLRELPGGRRGGAWARILPLPSGAATLILTLLIAPGATPDQTAAIADQELQAILAL